MVNADTLASIIFFSLTLTTPAWPLPPCPFSQPPTINCTCIDGQGDNTYNRVSCLSADVDTLPKFNANPGQYKIAGTFQILLPQYAKTVTIESDSFLDFVSIDELEVTQKDYGIPPSSPPPSLVWSDTALRGTQVSNITLNGILNVNSVFPPLSATQKQYLTKIKFLNCDGYNLDRGALKDLQHLQSIETFNTPINAIDSMPFEGVEDTLTAIYMEYANLSERFYPAVKGLQELKILDLTGNPFEAINWAAFDGLTKLESLTFNFAQLESISVADLDKIPSSVIAVSIQGTGIKSIPSALSTVLDRPQFQSLDLSTSTYLICDDSIKWTAKYALCKPTKLRIEGARCANLPGRWDTMELEQYLKDNVPNPCGQ